MTDAPPKARPASHNSDRQQPKIACALLMAVVVAYGLHTLLISGPEMQAHAQAQLAQTLADEDHDVCAQLGIRAGTTQSSICSRELANVRRKQLDRDLAATAGLL